MSDLPAITPPVGRRRRSPSAHPGDRRDPSAALRISLATLVNRGNGCLVGLWSIQLRANRRIRTSTSLHFSAPGNSMGTRLWYLIHARIAGDIHPASSGTRSWSCERSCLMTGSCRAIWFRGGRKAIAGHRVARTSACRRGSNTRNPAAPRRRAMPCQGMDVPRPPDYLAWQRQEARTRKQSREAHWI